MGAACPECGAPRRADRTPSCPCGPRAADALLETRTAEAAAAEDFNPLRIRPYVALDESDGAGAEPTGPANGTSTPDDPPAPDGKPADPAATDGKTAPHTAETTMMLRAPDPAPVPAEETPATAVTAVLPTPLAPPSNAPNATDLRLFEPSSGAPTGPHTPALPGVPEPAPRRRPRRAAVVGAAVVAVVALGTAGYASGLFSYESPARSEAPADQVRAGVPEPSTDAASAEEITGDASASSAPASPSASAATSGEASPSSSASPSASSAAPSGSSSTAPSRSASASDSGAPATESEPTEDGPEEGTATVLRRGDAGPEVTELQLRLRQLHLYMDDVDGDYGRRVEDAVRTFQWARGIHSEELGTYGPKTREQLERETQEP
ncbi:peptidoglycan-binding protein [Streptomyces sp. NPDC023723]|uniref:peptidoglycan-binding domain-containing protein n=1 Tax=Streptomyces sp. NPDC023723 TaxID=3154323 RepID=UPI003403228F